MAYNIKDVKNLVRSINGYNYQVSLEAWEFSGYLVEEVLRKASFHNNITKEYLMQKFNNFPFIINIINNNIAPQFLSISDTLNIITETNANVNIDTPILTTLTAIVEGVLLKCMRLVIDQCLMGTTKKRITGNMINLIIERDIDLNTLSNNNT
jgi:hypothetical protein